VPAGKTSNSQSKSSNPIENFLWVILAIFIITIIFFQLSPQRNETAPVPVPASPATPPTVPESSGKDAHTVSKFINENPQNFGERVNYLERHTYSAGRVVSFSTFISGQDEKNRRIAIDLINDILDLSKIESGEVEVFREIFSLNKTIQSCVAIVSERVKKHKLKLNVFISEGENLVYADERKMKQILLNLLTNAIKFTPEGGDITVRAESTDAGIKIVVKDSGIGIDPKDQEKIFEEFKQVENDYTRKMEGTGLGLAIVKRLIHLQNGWLKLDSVLGEGASFTFFIPKVESGVSE
jgi:signal transduction histidine kinase